MPIVAVSITKRGQFQGQLEYFSNIYTMNSGVDFGDDWSGVAQALANLERSICESWVTMDSYDVWTLEGTQRDRVIIDQGGITGTGQATNRGVYRECAVAIKFPISRSPVLRRRRWLRKWLHGVDTGGDIGVSEGLSPMVATRLTTIQNNYVNPLISGGPFSAFPGVVFCNVDGERPTEGVVSPYLEHRQFHR